MKILLLLHKQAKSLVLLAKLSDFFVLCILQCTLYKVQSSMNNVSVCVSVALFHCVFLYVYKKTGSGDGGDGVWCYVGDIWYSFYVKEESQSQ